SPAGCLVLPGDTWNREIDTAFFISSAIDAQRICTFIDNETSAARLIPGEGANDTNHHVARSGERPTPESDLAPPHGGGTAHPDQVSQATGAVSLNHLPIYFRQDSAEHGRDPQVRTRAESAAQRHRPQTGGALAGAL